MLGLESATSLSHKTNAKKKGEGERKQKWKHRKGNAPGCKAVDMEADTDADADGDTVKWMKSQLLLRDVLVPKLLALVSSHTAQSPELPSSYLSLRKWPNPQLVAIADDHGYHCLVDIFVSFQCSLANLTRLAVPEPSRGKSPAHQQCLRTEGCSENFASASRRAEEDTGKKGGRDPMQEARGRKGEDRAEQSSRHDNARARCRRRIPLRPLQLLPLVLAAVPTRRGSSSWKERHLQTCPTRRALVQGDLALIVTTTRSQRTTVLPAWSGQKLPHRTSHSTAPLPPARLAHHALPTSHRQRRTRLIPSSSDPCCSATPSLPASPQAKRETRKRKTKRTGFQFFCRIRVRVHRGGAFGSPSFSFCLVSRSQT
ncbi:hypothetical protein B0H14DRAFT_2631520 [Mycena olivaceomarginata]|nr:hypothetical protein B0H14DRAFT_2631520 [Mycena olivaceomarginata]